MTTSGCALNVHCALRPLVRSPNATNSYNVRNVNTSGAENNNNAYNGDNGLRPALVDTATE